MITITSARYYFVFWVAATTDDNRDVHIAAALTRRGAERKLLEGLNE